METRTGGGLRNGGIVPNIRTLWPPGGGDFDGAFDMLRTFDLAETKVPFGGSGFGPTIECADRN